MIAAIVLAQTESKAFATFIPIIAALVGGILTAGGGFLANYFQLSASREMERRQFYRERLEQIYLWVNQVEGWMEGEFGLWQVQESKVPQSELFKLRSENVENPISRLRLSVDFYFPELNPEVTSLEKCIESFSESLADNDANEANAHYQRVQDIRTHFIDKINPLVGKYV